MTDVVVGVDESDGAAEALRWAVREAELHGWSVTAVLAWGYLDQHRTHLGGGFDAHYDETDAREALAGIVERTVGAAAPSVRLAVVCDLATRALLEAAEGADLLVVGARGLGGFRGLLLGSVSQHCLHHAPCAVAVVRPATATATAAAAPIVVGVDGSGPSLRALDWAIEEALARKAPVRVVTAWHPPYVGVFPATPALVDHEAFERAADETVSDAMARCAAAGVGAEKRTVQGPPAATLLRAAEDAQLVVVASRGLGGFASLLLGSVSDQVARHAACPVVVVRPGQGDDGSGAMV